MSKRAILAARATSSRAEARRAAILRAAKQLFLERGYDQVGVRDIASAAAISPALVYRYGWTKTELLAELVLELNDTQVAAMRAWRPPSRGTLADRVVDYLRRLYRLDIEHRELRRLGAAYGWMWSPEQDRKCRAQIVELLAPLRRLLTAARVDGVDTRLAAIWAAYWTYFRLAVIYDADADACAAEVRPLVELAVRGDRSG